MNALSPSYPDTYTAASAPDGWVSRAALNAEALEDGMRALNAEFECLQAEVADLDAKIYDLVQLAESGEATRNDIEEQAVLLRRMTRARLILQGAEE
ncbi:hypothetical protein [Pseudoroseomonas cervicalis]|uniref:hypothetical protein n=1 Tax=Teichococcus cervicalis TaxID=204525 RepID=UPI00277F256C|nr:hypothetical protein [Pseudoroseomonas cervicalis]MDQ1077977.1 hypothetical protein [Pseudoroseomonas cervicalis]